jgi:hypothetical protein
MKKLLLIVFFLLFAGISYSQDKPFNTVFTVGHYFQNDISLSVGGRFAKDVYVTYEHGHKFDSVLQYNYIGIGLANDKSIALLKWGAKTEPYGSTHINYTDYGVEYLWIDRYMEKNICYGLTITKRNAIGFKIGLFF